MPSGLEAQKDKDWLALSLAITWSLLSLGSPVINKRKRIGGDPKERQVMAWDYFLFLMPPAVSLSLQPLGH